MTETRVTKDVAIRFKALGYDWECDERLHIKLPKLGAFKSTWGNWNASKLYLSIPTLSDAVRWLREVKGVHVVVEVSKESYCKLVLKYECYILRTNKPNLAIKKIVRDDKGDLFFPTHDLATIAGINAAIEHIEKLENKEK